MDQDEDGTGEYGLFEELVENQYQQAVERSVVNYLYTGGYTQGIAVDYLGDRGTRRRLTPSRSTCRRPRSRAGFAKLPRCGGSGSRSFAPGRCREGREPRQRTGIATGSSAGVPAEKLTVPRRPAGVVTSTV